MASEVIYINDTGNRWEFRVDGATVFIYADCYKTAITKLKSIYGKIIVEG